MENYTKDEVRKVQLEDDIVGKSIKMVRVRWGTTTGRVIICGSSR